ncbi:DNA cytosine methyltransferase, partial [Candidatus Bathyarchaeota archaeon]|nr:DNA cytosine methyltransferase [Candidatus Bathyarchaeota archaeon]
MQSEKAERPIAYALFAGAGGFHLGLEMAGFNIILATDINPYAEQTHRVNWPNVPCLCEDIRTIT